MKVTAVVVIGAVCAILAVAIFAVIATQQTFPVFQPSSDAGHFVNVNAAVGAEDGRFMWDSDSLALIAQAFALFAAAAATLGLIRFEEEKTPQ